MKLYAISDLHLDFDVNRQGIEEMPTYANDWLALVGDVGHKVEHLRFALDCLGDRFAQLIWVPGNHDLWSEPSDDPLNDPQAAAGEALLRGEAKYRKLVELCQERGVLTPEDPFVVWPGDRGSDDEDLLIVPLFLLYDYSFCPPELTEKQAIVWAAETKVICVDEMYLAPHPHVTRPAWCRARCAETERRLNEALAEHQLARTVLISHWPLRQDTARTPRIPRFTIWCGTRLSEHWHRRFRAEAVVYGHLHIPQSQTIDGVRFEEVSLGYPRQWDQNRGLAKYLRLILDR